MKRFLCQKLKQSYGLKWLITLAFGCTFLGSTKTSAVSRCEVHLDHTLVEAADHTPVTCQLLGTCILHARMGSLSSVVKDKNGKAIALSADHYMLNSYLDSYLRFFFITRDTEFEKILSSQFIRDKTMSIKGAPADDIILLRGVRPMESWSPKIQFEHFVNSDGPKFLLHDEEFVRLSKQYFEAVRNVKTFIPTSIGVSYMSDLLIYANFSLIYFLSPELKNHDEELRAAFRLGEKLREYTDKKLRLATDAPDAQFVYQEQKYDEFEFSQNVVEPETIHTKK